MHIITYCSQKGIVHSFNIFSMSSLCFKTRSQKSINSNISFCKIEIIFKSLTRLLNFFCFKDETLLSLRSNLVYTFACGRCNATGKTCCDFKVRTNLDFNEQVVQMKKNQQVLRTICCCATN